MELGQPGSTIIAIQTGRRPQITPVLAGGFVAGATLCLPSHVPWPGISSLRVWEDGTVSHLANPSAGLKGREPGVSALAGCKAKPRGGWGAV